MKAQQRLRAALVAAALIMVPVVGWRADRAATPERPVERPPARIIGEARVTAYPGYDMHLGADFAGILAHVYVKEGDSVKAGDRLADFDASVQKAALAVAETRISEMQAHLRFAEPRAQRGDALLRQSALSQESLDERRRDLEVAQAQLHTAQAEAERLRAEIAHSVVKAPIAGTILTRLADSGETLDQGAVLFRLADLSRLQLTADIDEFDISGIRPGAVATIMAEGYPEQSWFGQVEEVPHLVTGRQLEPLDPAAPSDVGVVRVKITLPPKHPFRLGQRVEVEIAAESGGVFAPAEAHRN